MRACRSFLFTWVAAAGTIGLWLSIPLSVEAESVLKEPTGGYSLGETGVGTSSVGIRLPAVGRPPILYLANREPGGMTLRDLPGRSSNLQLSGAGNVIAEPLRTISVGGYGIVDLLPDEKTLIAAGVRETYRLDLETGKILHRMSGPTSEIIAAVVNPNGSRIAACCYDGTAWVWDGATGAPLNKVDLGRNTIPLALSFTQDGDRLLVAGATTVHLWHLSENRVEEVVRFPDYPFDQIYCVAFLPDGQRYLLERLESGLKLMDIGTSVPLRSYDTDGSQISALAAFPNENRFLAGGWAGSLHLFDVDESRSLSDYRPHGAYIYQISITPDGAAYTAASADGSASVYRPAGPIKGRLLRENGYAIGFCKLFDGGTRAVTSDGDYTLRIWESQTGLVERELGLSDPVIKHFAVSLQGDKIATGAGTWQTANGVPTYKNFDLQYWHIAERRRIRSSVGHKDSVMAMAFSPDGTRLITGSMDTTARIWDVASGKSLFLVKEHTQAVTDVGFSTDGTLYFTASLDGKVIVWDRETSQPLQTIVPEGSLATASFSTSGTQVVTGTTNGRVAVWDAPSGTLLHSYKPRGGYTHSTVLSPDGKRILVTTERQDYLMETATGLVLWTHEWEPYRGGLAGRYSPDGRRVATRTWTHVRILDAETGEVTSEIAAGLTFFGSISDMVFAPDGRSLYTSDWIGGLREWSLEIPDGMMIR